MKHFLTSFFIHTRVILFIFAWGTIGIGIALLTIQFSYLSHYLVIMIKTHDLPLMYIPLGLGTMLLIGCISEFARKLLKRIEHIRSHLTAYYSSVKG
jgi:hypothetical protein